MTPSVIIPTEYGNILCNRFDGYQTNAFLKWGKANDWEEIKHVEQFIIPGTCAIDIGTCFGAWTLAFSKRAAYVYSFEAQRILHNYLCGSLALNGIENVFTFNAVVSDKPGFVPVPKYDYNKDLEMGCVYFCPRTNQGESLQPVQPSTESVQVVAIDQFDFSNVSVMKVDVEGMEMEVLNGARKTIEKNRPVLYLEILLLGRQGFKDFLEPQDYYCFDNGANLMALPKEKYELEFNGDKLYKVTLK